MKRAITIGLALASLSAYEADAHLYGRKVPMDSSYGLSSYWYEWHGDPVNWKSAVIENAKTNQGVWESYPPGSWLHLEPEGRVGPVETQRFYKATFYLRWFPWTETTSMTWIGADICGMAPSGEEK